MVVNISTSRKCDGNGNAYDRGDYNSSFALRAVELKRARTKKMSYDFFHFFIKYFSHCPLSADTSFKSPVIILFVIWHLQNFISIFSRAIILQREIIWGKPKKASAIFP